MATYSPQTYTADGSTANFGVPFGYLDQKDIVVTVNGAAATFTWLNSSTITLATTPANGDSVVISRATPIDSLFKTFSDPAAFNGADINNALDQLRYALEEFVVTRNAGNATAADLVTLQDAGNFFPVKQVEAALQQVGYDVTGAAETLTANTLLDVSQGGKLVISDVTANVVHTLPSAPPKGTFYAFLSNASYTVEVDTGVTTGSPKLVLPDASTAYSFVLPAVAGSALIVYFDGTDWASRTVGRTVVADAVNGNEAVSLKQAQADFAKIGGDVTKHFLVKAASATGQAVEWDQLQSADALYNTSSASALTTTASIGPFTAPCNGRLHIFLWGGANNNTMAPSTVAISLAGSSGEVDIYENGSNGHYQLPMASGQQTTVDYTVNVGTSGFIVAQVYAFFVPNV